MLLTKLCCKLGLCFKEFFVVAVLGFDGCHDLFFLWWCSADISVSIRVLYFCFNCWWWSVQVFTECSAHLASCSASVLSGLHCLSTIGVLVAPRYLPVMSLVILDRFPVGSLFCLTCQVFHVGPVVCPCHSHHCLVCWGLYCVDDSDSNPNSYVKLSFFQLGKNKQISS